MTHIDSQKNAEELHSIVTITGENYLLGFIEDDQLATSYKLQIQSTIMHFPY